MFAVPTPALATAAFISLILPGVTHGQTDSLAFPLGLARGPGTTVYWSERRGHVVRRLDLETGAVVTVAGTGQPGFSGDGGPATAAQLRCPDAVDTDTRGNLYIADRCNERIRRVDAATGVITTVAGNGQRGRSEDGPALDRSLMGVFFLRVASDDRILFTDTDTDLIRELDLGRGRISTLAGTGVRGFSGDGGPATAATFARPHVVIRARNGDLIIGDSFNHRIRRVDATTGIIRTIAGSGMEGVAADGTPLVAAPFMYFGTLVEEPNGNLLVTEWARRGRLSRLDLASGRLQVLAGNVDMNAGTTGSGTPLDATFGGLAGLVVDDSGRFVVVDSDGGIKRIDLARNRVEVLAGR